jgi:hypothetical protein
MKRSVQDKQRAILCSHVSLQRVGAGESVELQEFTSNYKTQKCSTDSLVIMVDKLRVMKPT